MVHEHCRDSSHSQFHTIRASTFARVGSWEDVERVQRSGSGRVGGRCVTQRHAWFLRFGRRPECWFAAKFATESGFLFLVGGRRRVAHRFHRSLDNHDCGLQHSAVFVLFAFILALALAQCQPMCQGHFGWETLTQPSSDEKLS
jgi:hypothetical protein